jgi:DNA polymerase-3 subunit alpha
MEASIGDSFRPNFTNGANDDFSERDKQSMEYELLGLFVSNHPMASVKTLSTCISSTDIQALENLADNTKVTITALITTFEKKITKSKKIICILKLEDEQSRMEAVMFSKALDKFETLIEKGKRVVLSGTLSKHSEGNMSLMVDSVQDMDSMSVMEIEVNVSELADYYSFFHSLRALLSRSENSGNSVVICNLIDGSERRKMSMGSKLLVADNDITRASIEKLKQSFAGVKAMVA